MYNIVFDVHLEYHGVYQGSNAEKYKQLESQYKKLEKKYDKLNAR